MTAMKFNVGDEITPVQVEDGAVSDPGWTGIIVAVQDGSYQVSWSDLQDPRGQSQDYIDGFYELLSPPVEWKFKSGDKLIEKSQFATFGRPNRRTVVAIDTDADEYRVKRPEVEPYGLSREYVEYYYKLDVPAEPKYTLEEARKKLREEGCNLHGHSYSEITTFASNDPIQFVCSNGCGGSWNVVSNG